MVKNSLHNPDVLVENLASFCLFDPITPAARSWLEESVDGQSTWYGTTLVVEHRYLWGLACALADAGFFVASRAELHARV